jgi:hypothetical protein
MYFVQPVFDESNRSVAINQGVIAWWLPFYPTTAVKLLCSRDIGNWPCTVLSGSLTSLVGRVRLPILGRDVCVGGAALRDAG